MAALLQITVLDPQDQLDRFGAGAKVYINRGTTDDVDDASSLTSIAIVAGTTFYEHRDDAGTPGTDRYFFRYGTAVPATADDYSDWTGPVLAGSLEGGPLNLEIVKTWGNIDDDDDDPWLPLAYGSCNRAIVSGIGVDLGPSPDTTRTYDADAAVADGRRLRIPGGIRTFTTVEVSNDGTTWTAVTSQVRVGPSAHSRAPGEPGAYIEAIPGQTLRFDAYLFVRITGPAFQTFGWEAWPMDVVQAGVAAVQRMSLDRGRRGDYPNETNALRYLDMRVIHAYRSLYFPGVR